MKFDYVIGNPPYQSSVEKDNVPIWPKFVYEGNKISNIVCMIHPGRWVVPTASYIKIFENMKNYGLKVFKYYPRANDIFPSIGLDGGITITYFENDYKNDISYYVNNINKGIYDTNIKFFTTELEEEAFNKIFNKIKTDKTMQDRINSSIAVDGVHCYNFIKDNNLNFIVDSSINLNEPVKIWISKTQGRSNSKFNWYYIDKQNLVNIDNSLYNSRKVAIDGRGNALVHGKGNVFNNIPQICNRNQLAFGNILIFPQNDTDKDLNLIKSLFMTKTARYLMCITQKSLRVRGFENIPDYLELAKLLSNNELFTDEWFYKTFDFSKELINEIETRVSEKIEK